MNQQDLDFLQTFNDIPPNLLNYPIHVPTLGDIQKILQAFSGGSGNAIPGPAAGQANCSKFKPTSPLGTMPGKDTTFYWDPAPGATRYVVRVYDSGGAVTGEFSVDAPLTYVTGNPGGKDNMSWEVAAYVDGQLACTTARTNVFRDTVYETNTSKPTGGGGPTVTCQAYFTCLPPCSLVVPLTNCSPTPTDYLCSCP
jgi:hypothetical protein